MKRRGGHILLPLVLAIAASAGGFYWYYGDAIDIESRSFSEVRALLDPYIQVYTPAAGTPAPAILFFHGCGGLSKATMPRVRSAMERGYVAIVVDSLSPRQIDWQMNCDGRVLHGPERAADVLAALDFARQHPAVDAANLQLVAYSHGSWTALEALALPSGELPPGLTDGPDNPWDGVRGIVAWYPYCGWAARFHKGWSLDIPVLMLLAEQDEITDPGPCARIAREQAARGLPVYEITFPGVSHGFDRDEDWVLRYDPDAARRALATQFEFLQRHRG
jgi:dienelactone hydrolase